MYRLEIKLKKEEETKEMAPEIYTMVLYLE